MRPKDKNLLCFVRYHSPITRVVEFEDRECNCSHTWEIENYQQRRQDAIDGIKTASYSTAFYTSVRGYKLCLGVNLNGVSSGAGNYFALFVHIMLGDYDGNLRWPFTPGMINFFVLDQSEGTASRQHIKKSLKADSNLLVFHRPAVAGINGGVGFAEFAPIDHIREPLYIKNDTLLVKVEIKGSDLMKRELVNSH